MKVILDSGPAGLITNPNLSSEAVACRQWLNSMLLSGHEVALPEIIDYEIRRELVRAKKLTGLIRLDELHDEVTFLSLDRAVMLKAADLWAQARQAGKPTAHAEALDIDVILAAQTWMFRNEGEFAVIATLNKKHLAQFVPAEHWKDIHPI